MTRSEAEDCGARLVAKRMIFVDENTQGCFGMVRTCIRLMLTMKLTLSKLSSRNSVRGGFLIFGLFRNILTRTVDSEY